MCHELGMGALVLGPERLPNLNPADEISQHLGHNYGTVCETADGFAQVSTNKSRGGAFASGIHRQQEG